MSLQQGSARDSLFAIPDTNFARPQAAGAGLLLQAGIRPKGAAQMYQPARSYTYRSCSGHPHTLQAGGCDLPTHCPVQDLYSRPCG